MTVVVEPRLRARTEPIPDPGDLLAELPDPAPLAWVRRGEGIVGWGEAASLTVPEVADRDGYVLEWLSRVFTGAEIDDTVGIAGTGPIAFGSLTFDRASAGSRLVVPRTVVGRRDGRAWLTRISSQAAPDPPPSRPRRSVPIVSWYDGALSAPDWQAAVARAVTEMRAGDYHKVVLARDLYARAAGPIDARVVLDRLAARFPDCYTYACAGLVGATPELLVRRDGEQISSLVLAGSMPRGSTPDEDDRLGAELLASTKETSEHAFAAESARDALAPLCSRLHTDPRPRLVRFANIQHLATDLYGTLAGDTSSVAVAAALHPTAAVGGTPTGRAVPAIRRLEQMDRDRYTGPVGWVDADGNGEWGIALRCAQLAGGTARLFAGCGIVAGSDPATELAEAQAKFRAMRHALGE